MDKGEKLTIAGDVSILIIIALLLAAGLVSSSSVISDIAYVLVGGFLTLSVWGFRHRILGQGQKSEAVPPTRVDEVHPAPKAEIANAEKEEVIADETKVIRSSEYEYYPVTLTKKDKMFGTVVSDLPIDIYIMEFEEIDDWDRGKDFTVEDEREGIKRFTVDFTPPKKGTWCLILDNSDGADDAEVIVNLKSSTVA
jgi:hypothetical protein